MRGKFITFEGSEGSGKSTQINMIKRYLRGKGKKVLFVREPGGVRISEMIRKILLDVKNTEMGSECETLLYMSARAQLVEEVVKPALKQGKIVLCDRFLDSTVVYQGFGAGIDINEIKRIGRFAIQNIRPDLTIVFDIPTKTGLSRIKGVKDRIEKRTIHYHDKVRNGYLKLAKSEPKRIKVIKVNKDKNQIHEIVKDKIKRALKIK